MCPKRKVPVMPVIPVTISTLRGNILDIYLEGVKKATGITGITGTYQRKVASCTTKHPT